MATVSFTHDDKPPIDRTLEAMGEAAKAERKPLKVRLQPDLYDQVRATYTAWLGLTWAVELRDVEEGRKLRVGLAHFFKAFGGDARRQQRLLAELAKLAGVRR